MTQYMYKPNAGQETHLDPPDEPEFETESCDNCDRDYQLDKDSTFETDNMKVCSMCNIIIAEELNIQADEHGKMSMTEDEQAFMEWWDEGKY